MQLWKAFQSKKDLLQSKNNKKSDELYLFHGTNASEPSLIYGSHDGLSVNFAQEGVFGRGVYFAENASYSVGSYAFKPPGTKHQRQVFCACVAVGEIVYSEPNGKLRLPPFMKGSNGGVQIRYDTVQGKTGGTVVYIAYENHRAYPEYLITFEKL
jgi:hypothetical protein